MFKLKASSQGRRLMTERQWVPTPTKETIFSFRSNLSGNEPGIFACAVGNPTKGTLRTVVL